MKMPIQVITPTSNSISVLNDLFISFLRKNKHSYSNWSFSHGECMFYAYAFSKVLDDHGISYQICSYISESSQNGHVFFKVKVHGKVKYFDSENVYSFCDSWKKLQKTYNKVPSKITIHKSRSGIVKLWNIPPEKVSFWDEQVKNFLKLSTFAKICL